MGPRLSLRSAEDDRSVLASGIAAVEIAKLLHEPVPGFRLARAGGLVDGDLRDRSVSRATFSRGRKSRRLDRIASSITAAWARLKPENGACETARSSRVRKRGRCSSSATSSTASSQCAIAAASRGTGPAVANGRPVAPAGEAAGEDAHVVDMACHRVRHLAKVVERARGPERGDDPMLAVGDDAERRDVDRAGAIDRGDDRLADHRHWLSRPSWRAACGPPRRAASGLPPAGRRPRPSRAARPARSACRGRRRSPPS